MDNKLVDGIIPPQPPIKPVSDVHEVKARLEWGEPAFTILDVRDRDVYNDGHIMGAMAMPMEQLPYRAETSLEHSRDIYIYGETEAQSAEAVQVLRNSGFEHVSQLRGGLEAWKAVGGPTEGIVESLSPPGKGDYNVVSRISEHIDSQKKEV